MRLPVLTIPDVVAAQLCSGCGACAAAEPGRYRMVDVTDVGLRPVERGDGPPVGARGPVPVGARPAGAGPGFEACPGRALAHDFDERDPALDAELRPAWGPVLHVWEGHAADPEIRRAGSSGGAASALALHALERGGAHGVLHTAAREDRPYLNRTVLSRSRAELLDRTGSRYAPASPCEGLGLIEAAPGPCVFIGKPCDVAGAQRSARLRPELERKLALTIAFFCAGTPSTRGTLDLLKKAGVEDPDAVRSLRYRGNGWPGRWTVQWTDARGESREASMTYDESWGVLEGYRQWRCYICPDHTGEFADVAVGDPWYRKVEPDEPGKSLILARTPRGLEAVRAAERDGYLVLEREDASLLPRSQPNLLQTRGRLWGQLLALRLSGAAVPSYRGFPTFAFWLRALSVKSKSQSTFGTLRRVKRKCLRARLDVAAMPRKERAS